MTSKGICWEAELDLNLVNKSIQDSIKTKKIFRYQFKDSPSPVNILEEAISNYIDSEFALGVSSATNAIFLALKSIGVSSNSKVLIPAFTFTAVPSAVVQCGAEPVLVDITEKYVIDLEDLELKITSSGAKYLLLSHMRGHLCDMDKVVKICQKHSIYLVEDAAHALGVTWKGKHAGTFGIAGVYSLQSYKVINAGEGGLLVTNNPDIFWKSVFMSGSYENNYLLHSKKNLDVSEKYKSKLPVFNVRMNNLTASLAIPQIEAIEARVGHINKNYDVFEEQLSNNSLVEFVKRLDEVRPVRDSAQFRVKITEKAREEFKSALQKKGIPISYFGGINNTNARLYQNWKFIDTSKANLPNTKKYLSEVFDLRLPVHFNLEIIKEVSSTIIEILNDIKIEQ